MTEHLISGHNQSSKKKVRSGCQTCKLRKVKCDEGRPVCRRCQSSGRICDGYGIWGGGGNAYGVGQDCAKDQAAKSKCSSASLQAGLIRPVQLMLLEAGEYGCFEWYMHRSAVKLPGAFASEYWTMLLCQASEAEPAIRHAVIALASAHKEEVRGTSSLTLECNDEQTLFTVHQYNKAINCLKPCFTDKKTASMRITLIACALFVYMEFLRGHYSKGITHLEHGLSLLQGIQKCVDGSKPSSTLVDGWLVTIFTRLFVQAKLLGQCMRVPCQNFLHFNLQPDRASFRSIHHARRSLEQIMLHVFNLQDKAHQSAAARPARLDNDLRVYQKSIQDQLHSWIQNNETTLQGLPSTHNVIERFAYRLLELYYAIAIILADTCLENLNEVRFDCHGIVFLNIVTRCIEIYKFTHPHDEPHRKGHHDPEPSSPNSISDIGWIAPLYFTAIKCRTPRIRHQAVKLLQSTPHKEGIWNTLLAVITAEKVIEIEERDFYGPAWEDEFDKLAIPTDDDLATPIIPEEFRLSELNVMLPDNRAGKLSLRCCRKEQNGIINWINKEYDLPSRQWTTIHEPHEKDIDANS